MEHIGINMSHKSGGLLGLVIIGLAGVAIWKLAEDGVFDSVIKPFTDGSSNNEGGLFGGNVIPSSAYQVNVAT